VGWWNFSKRNRNASRRRHAYSINKWRRCRFEQMESRRLLSITPLPINLGVVYFEDSSPFDEAGDLFEITFNDGAPGTQLVELSIDTDKLGDGLTIGDVFFDTTTGGLGAYAATPFTLLSHEGFELVSYEVSDGGTQLLLRFSGFDAGEKLVFSIDVDEQGFLGPNAVAEGNEFEGSKLLAQFSAPHYYDAFGEDMFIDAFDTKLSGTGLSLPNDNYVPSSPFMPSTASPGPVYTAGAIITLEQQPLPVTISGTVFADPNADNVRQSGEHGIAGVELTLYVFEGEGYLDTGITTTTDADGNYRFEDLLPGTYRVVEIQPAGYLSVGAMAGTVGGATRGVVTTVDVISDITLYGGEDSIHNDFAETLPACLSGYVYHDANNNGLREAGEQGIGGAVVTLLDASGEPTGLTAFTDAAGYYRFCGLMPGQYAVAETQPDGYFDGLDTAGSVGGAAHNPGDLIDGIVLSGGVAAVNYNFGELMPASIGGRVFADLNGNGVADSGEPLLSGVTIYLLDAGGARIAATTTDSAGKYVFTGLQPGYYGVEEIQPAGYLDGDEQVGTAGGAITENDKIQGAYLPSGVDGRNYDFWEIIPARISGYVFQDGPAIVVYEGDPMPEIPALRDGRFTPDDKPLAGVRLMLCDGSGYPLLDAEGNPIVAVTNAAGYYEFTMLMPGVYSVVEEPPAGFLPGLNSAGSKGGLVVNCYADIDPLILSTLAVDTSDSAIVRIPLAQGDAAVDYNFSHVVIVTQPKETPPFYPPYYPPVAPTPVLPPPTGLPFGEYHPVGQYYVMPIEIVRPPLLGGGGFGGYSWHLSVINGGQPRADSAGAQFVQTTSNPYFDPISWSGAALDRGRWLLADKEGKLLAEINFGFPGALPVTGDWNGDGITDLGVFCDGVWWLDLNGDGAWDNNDLWIKLGRKGDQPVSGDWDGDGKSDIGIFGPAWVGDHKAVAVEPGLPDAQNPPKQRPKNLPPKPQEAAIGWRTMKKGTAGKLRSDLIDHVFQFGGKDDLAVVGDWNGDGIHTIGVFRNGAWYLDVDGDGQWSTPDLLVEFGKEGDLPVVGDWTGDGVTKLGVYRNGTFYLDVNNNHQLDAQDKVLQFGAAGDRPVSGDWDGDGADEVGVYQAAPAPDAGAEPST